MAGTSSGAAPAASKIAPLPLPSDGNSVNWRIRTFGPGRSASSLSVGDKVCALYAINGWYYNADIESIDANGTVTVNWHDKDTRCRQVKQDYVHKGTDKSLHMFDDCVAMPDGRVVGIPFRSSAVLFIDPIAGTTERLEIPSQKVQLAGWQGGVALPDGRIVAVPCNSPEIMVIDPFERKLDFFGDLGDERFKWSGGVALPDGRIVCMPCSSDQVLVIDPKSRTTDLFGSFKGNHKWGAGILTPSGKVLGIPDHASEALLFDPVAMTTDVFGNFGKGNAKWKGGVMAPNGIVVCVPYCASQALFLDPEKKTSEFLGNFGDEPAKWTACAELFNGKVVGIPSSCSRVLVIDPIQRCGELVGDLSAMEYKWSSGACTPDGQIVGVPESGSDVLVIDVVPTEEDILKDDVAKLLQAVGKDSQELQQKALAWIVKEGGNSLSDVIDDEEVTEALLDHLGFGMITKKRVKKHLADQLKTLAKSSATTFEGTNFYAIYRLAEAPKDIFSAMQVIGNFVDKVGDVHAIPAGELSDFKSELSRIVLGHSIKGVAQCAAVLWTTQHHMKGRELCSFLNEAVRNDDGDFLEAAIPLCRLLNSLVVSRGERRINAVTNSPQTYAELVESCGKTYTEVQCNQFWATLQPEVGPYPPNNKTYRGLGIPLAHRSFFKRGVRFRTRMYFASSFTEKTGKYFAAKSKDPPTMFETLFDAPPPQGLGCVHAHFLDAISVCSGEEEWLMPPYSAFEVIEEPDWQTPSSGLVSVIKLRALHDNQVADAGLPLAPWS